MMTFALIAGGVYLVRAFIFAVATKRSPLPPAAGSELPAVTVIVAARNEEGNIARCLDSLARQEYPADRLEIFVMNDGSTDRTGALVAEYAARYPNVRCIDVHDELSHLRGKARAVAQGIDVARGEILATTDADCRVGPRWVSETVRQFDGNTGLVAGFTLQEPHSIFGAAQALDWGFLQSIGSASFSLGKPLGCIGNNLFFRSAAYQEVGGYRGFKFSITEDFALQQAIEKTGKWVYKYPLSREALVWSEPCPDLGTLWRQKRRWAQGGKRLGMRGVLMGVASVLINGTIVVSLVSGAWSALAVALALRWSSDLLLLAPTLFKLGVPRMLRYFIPYECYALVYELALPVGMLRSSVQWKGRTF